jgi:hypothetical protein
VFGLVAGRLRRRVSIHAGPEGRALAVQRQLSETLPPLIYRRATQFRQMGGKPVVGGTAGSRGFFVYANSKEEIVAELTSDDINLLIEATEAWENKDQAGEMLSDLFAGMLSERTPEARQKIEAETALRKGKNMATTRTRKERSVVLRAKLISIRDSMIADKMTQTEKLEP